MQAQAFELRSRRAASALTRRTSLAALGGAAILGTRPQVSAAKKGGASCSKKLKKRCTSNADQCNANGAILCQGDASCLATLAFCCNQCFSAGFVQCLAASA